MFTWARKTAEFLTLIGLALLAFYVIGINSSLLLNYQYLFPLSAQIGFCALMLAIALLFIDYFIERLFYLFD